MSDYKSRVYTDRPAYADFDAPHKFMTIQTIIAERLAQHPNAMSLFSDTNASLRPCPFCGGKARISLRKEYRQEYSLDERTYKRKFRCQAICNRCHARGAPVKFYSGKWGAWMNVPYLIQCEDIEPWVRAAAEYWNGRCV